VASTAEELQKSAIQPGKSSFPADRDQEPAQPINPTAPFQQKSDLTRSYTLFRSRECAVLNVLSPYKGKPTIMSKKVYEAAFRIEKPD
jgi:hypothetical protein